MFELQKSTKVCFLVPLQGHWDRHGKMSYFLFGATAAKHVSTLCVL